MYQVTATYGQYSSTMSSQPTLAKACDEQAFLYDYYTALYANTHVWIEQYCDTCTHGKVQVCKAPKRHSNGFHSARCYKVCPTCKGHYVTPIDA